MFCVFLVIKFITHHWGKIIRRERRLLERESRHDDVWLYPGQTYKYHTTYHAAPPRSIGKITLHSVRTKNRLSKLSEPTSF